MAKIMKTIRMEKRSYEGYCVGTGVEYPGIIVSATSDDELIRLFKAAIPSHERALKKYDVEEEETSVTVIAVDRESVTK